MTASRSSGNTSKHEKAFAWIWLPDEVEPVMAGTLHAHDGMILFSYSAKYLERIESGQPAISIYEPELPLQPGWLAPQAGLTLPNCIRDAAPDAWGRRVIIYKMLGLAGTDADTEGRDEWAYLLESGSDRIGALDFQRSPGEYVPRSAQDPNLNDLVESAEHVEKGVPLKPELEMALIHGSSIGGARPKALIQDRDKKYIAKFPLGADHYNVVKAEFIAMRLANLAGLNVASVKLANALKKDVLLVERFDRECKGKNRGWSRKAMVSALTMLGLSDMTARYASYEDLAEIIRHRFTDPKATLREMFSRLAFNILCGNTDDHARNHAAFWNGRELTLTPGYDICPQGRTGSEASQGMLIWGNDNLSRLGTCLRAAENFLLSEIEAREIFAHLVETIEGNWDAVCEEAELSAADKALLWKRSFLNPFSVEH